MAGTATLTVLFCDLVGSTELLMRLGDEAGGQLRRRFFAAMRNAISTCGGQEVKALGDGLMVNFTSVSDGVDCAVAMQQAVARLDRRREPFGLALRVGLSVGEVTPEDGDWHGAPVIEAARLCATTQPGRILASDLVRSLLRERSPHRFSRAGAVELKGFPEPLDVVEVAWDRPASPPLPTALAPVAGDLFVGREQELAQLGKLWKSAAQGHRRGVLVAGEPGVGKTRLAAEFSRSVHAEGATVLYGRCDAEFRVAYQPFVEALRRPRTLGAGDVESWDAPSDMVLDSLVPALTGRGPDAHDPVRTDPEADRYQLFESVVGVFAEISEQAPVLLVLDDLHWATKPTLLLLRHLLRHAADMALLVVGTYRETEVSARDALSETLAELRRVEGVERVALHGFDQEEVGAVVAAVIGEPLGAGSVALTRALHGETEGNPFFVREILGHLRDKGALDEPERSWPSRLAGLGLPDSVKEVVGQRLARLSEATNDTLEVAAVVGPRFALEVVQLAAGIAEPEVIEHIEEAHRARIVTEVAGGVDEFSFSHALVREVLLDRLTATRRARLHRRAGEALEQTRAPDLEASLGELAYHFLEGARAGVAAEAVEYARRAGRQVLTFLAYEEAADLLERALQTMDLLDEPDDAIRFETLLLLGDTLDRAGDVERARSIFQDATKLAEARLQPQQSAEAALHAGARLAFAETGTVDDELVALLEDALASLSEDDSALRVRVMARLAAALYWSGSERRKSALSEEAVAMASRLDDPRTLAYALSCRHLALWGPENVGTLVDVSTELVALADRLGDKELALEARAWQIADLLEIGDMAGVDRGIELQSRLAEELRQPFYRSAARLVRAMRLLLTGSFDESEQLAWEALEIARGVRDPALFQAFGGHVFALRWLQGRLDELDESTVRGFVEQYPRVPAWRCGLALFQLATGRARDAEHEFEATLPQITHGARDQLWLGAVALSAEVSAALDLVGPAGELHELLREFSTHQVVVGQAAVCYGSAARYAGLAAATAGRLDEACALYEQALAMNTAADARPWLALTQADYARALRARNSRGDRERVADLMARALTTAEKLGMGTLARGAATLVEG